MSIGIKFIQDTKEFTIEIKDSINDYLRNVFGNIQKELPKEINKVFELEGARGGHEEWEPTSDIGRKYRVKVLEGDGKAFDFPTLTDTGELQRSLVPEIFESEDQFVFMYGTDIKYASKIEEGFSEPHPRSGGIVDAKAREFLFFTEEDSEEIIDVLFNDLWKD